MSQGDNINGAGETSALLQWRGDHGDRESADLLGWHFETVPARDGDAVHWHVSVLVGGDDDWRVVTRPHEAVADAKAEASTWAALAIGAVGAGEPIGWIEPQVFVDLTQRKPWTAGANNVFCQRRSERYSVPIFAVAATHSVTIPAAAPAGVSRAVLPMVLAPILAEIERAMRRFPTWPTDPIHAAAVVNEECGELVKAVLEAVYEPHKSTVDDVRAEAIQTAATAIRFIASLDRYEYARCPQHQQPAIASTHEMEAGTAPRAYAAMHPAIEWAR